MADEITTTFRLRVIKDGLNIERNAEGQKLDLASDIYTAGMQTIGTTEEAVTFEADQATVGGCYFRNADATNFLTLGVVENSVYRPFLRLRPGKVVSGAELAMAVGELYAKADTAACKLEKIILSL